MMMFQKLNIESLISVSVIDVQYSYCRFKDDGSRWETYRLPYQHYRSASVMLAYYIDLSWTTNVLDPDIADSM